VRSGEESVSQQLKSSENGAGSGVGTAALHRTAKEVAADLVEHFMRRAAYGDPSPKILVDEECNVLWSSAEAERLLQPPLPLWIKGGRLTATPAGGGRSWTSYIENLGEEGGRLLLTGPGATTWVLVTGCAERHEGYRLIFLKCAMSWPFRDVTSSGLAKDFGLTRSEAAVLDKFAQLKKPVQIAEELEITVSTVRSHLKQIHAKMSVNSGVQLLRITRAYCDT
jgi:DNA-binding CsgD family transcriptional regulator